MSYELWPIWGGEKNGSKESKEVDPPTVKEERSRIIHSSR